MTNRLNPILIRAIAATRLHPWAYERTDHLFVHGMNTCAGRRHAAIIRDHPLSIDAAHKAVTEHVERFDAELSRSMAPDGAAFCRAIMDADDVVLAWWCEHKFTETDI